MSIKIPGGTETRAENRGGESENLGRKIRGWYKALLKRLTGVGSLISMRICGYPSGKMRPLKTSRSQNVAHYTQAGGAGGSYGSESELPFTFGLQTFIRLKGK